MEYLFDIGHAEKYGLNEAIFLKNMIFWISKNRAHKKNLHDGRTWTYNSIKAYEELFPFWTESQIRRIIESLIKQGVIIKGNYNKVGYDRTMWYAFNDESICQISQMEVTKTANGSDENDKPIPDIKPDEKPNKKTYNEKEKYIVILNFWNSSHGLQKHEKQTFERRLQKKHRDIIDEYGFDDTVKAIYNYTQILRSDKHYFTYKWDMFKFIERGLEQFIDDSDPYNNFKKKDFSDKPKELDAYEISKKHGIG